MNDDELRAAAIVFAKSNKEALARELTDTKVYIPDDVPASVFMAGSPGAGKTEFSKAVLSLLEKQTKHRVLRIDSDDLRSRVPGYTGKNSYLFQGAVSIIAEKVHDKALSNGQTFIFDGTLWKYEKAVGNIRRSLDKKRVAFVFYVYQRPEIAWKFTAAREQAEGRHIPKSAFIEQFLGARKTVERLAKDFGPKVTVILVKKDFEKNSVEDIVNINDGRPIDASITERYTRDELERGL